MSNKILFVFEGEKTEVQLKEGITKHFLKKQTTIHCAFCSEVYQLYEKIKKDQYLDIFVLLQKMTQNKENLSEYTREDFAEVYLFFDYDGHATNAKDETIQSLLELFNNETEAGKLFISYPMVEAIKHISNKIDFKNLAVEAKKNIKYKSKVNEECDHTLKNLKRLTYQQWMQLVQNHLKKMNFITTNQFILPQQHVPQSEIFDNQLKKYLDIDATVAVLSAFPIFLFDYYGYNQIMEFINESTAS